GAETFYVDGA
nr:Chain P, GAG POLYPROTEIN [synthetic construct]